MRAAIIVVLACATACELSSALAQTSEQVSSVRGVKLGTGSDEVFEAMRKQGFDREVRRVTFTSEGVPYTAIAGSGSDFEMKFSMVVVLSPRREVVVAVCYTESYTTYSPRDPETIEKALTTKFGAPSQTNQSGLRTWWKTESGAPAKEGCEQLATDRVSPPVSDCQFYFRREGTKVCPIEVEAIFENSGRISEWRLKVLNHNTLATELLSYLEERERRRRIPPRL